MYVIHLALNQRMFLSGVKQGGYCLNADIEQALEYKNEKDAITATTKIANTNKEMWAYRLKEPIKKVNN